MAPADVVAAEAVADAAFGGELAPGMTAADNARAGQARIRHLLGTDRAGAWVAEHEERVAGVSLGIVREGIWGLSLLVVAPDLHARGIGGRLLKRALAHGAADTRGAIILSSEDPKAMRLYARAGFALHPAVAAAGVVDRAAIPAADPRVRQGAPAETAAVSRDVRGASHADDIPVMLGNGAVLLLVEDEGFVVHQRGTPRLLAARDPVTAKALLWAALAASEPGSKVTVDFLTAGQGWAIDVALRAGLPLKPDGPVFVRGELGPLRPYIPNGAYL